MPAQGVGHSRTQQSTTANDQPLEPAGHPKPVVFGERPCVAPVQRLERLEQRVHETGLRRQLEQRAVAAHQVPDLEWDHVRGTDALSIGCLLSSIAGHAGQPFRDR